MQRPTPAFVFFLLCHVAVPAEGAGMRVQRSMPRTGLGGALLHMAGLLEQPEPQQEKREEDRLKGTPEEDVVHGAVGMPHEGYGLETDVPRTVSEDSLESDNALKSVHGLAHTVVLPATAIFLMCIMLGNVLGLSKYTSFIPTSALTLFVAMLLGLVLHHAIELGWMTMESFTIMNATVLNLVLLPIIIFNSGWSLQKANFMSQFEYILIFAIFGTLISTMFIGFVSYGMGAHLGWHPMKGMRENMVFAALISAVDPVATLATYTKVGVAASQPLLNTMVFGESAINDAVAIVLFDVINLEWDELNVWNGVMKVGVLLFGSMGFGVLVACVLILVMRLAKLPGHTSAEILFIWVSAYFIYALAETVEVSGIIANLFAGMIFGVYGKKHLSAEGKQLANHYLELCGEAADTGVFILCGCSTAMITSTRGIKFGFIAVVLCLVARALSVSACAAASNALKTWHNETQETRLSLKHQVAMWHGGLRGGIALVLALEIDGRWCEHKGTIINATFIVICTLLLVLGGTTELLLSKLGMAGVTVDDDMADTDSDQNDGTLVDNTRGEPFYMKFFGAMDGWLAYLLVGPGKQQRKEPTKMAK